MDYPIVKCQHCGAEEKASYDIATKTRMVENNRCFTCDYWLELSNEHVKDENCFVVADNSPSMHPGVHLFIGKESNEKSIFKGFGGRKFEIEFSDGRKVISTNVWYQGPVPLRFKHLFTRFAKVNKSAEKAEGVHRRGGFYE